MLETPCAMETVATVARSRQSIPPTINASRTHMGKVFQGRPLVGKSWKLA